MRVGQSLLTVGERAGLGTKYGTLRTSPAPPRCTLTFPPISLSNARKNNKNQPATDESPTATMGTTCLGDGCNVSVNGLTRTFTSAL